MGLLDGLFGNYKPSGSTSNNLMEDVQNKRNGDTSTPTYSGTNIRYYANNKDKYYSVYKGSNGDYYYKDGSNYVKITNQYDIAAIERGIEDGTPKNGAAGPPAPRDVVSVKLQADMGATQTLAPSATVNDYAKQAEQAKAQTAAILSNTNSNSNSDIDKKFQDLIDNMNANYEADRKQQQANYEAIIQELKNQLPRKMGADEAAEYYGINVNYDNILRDYNQATNDYFNDATKYLTEYRDQSQIDYNRYGQDALRTYLESYKNSTPTASRKGAVAASALINMLNNSSAAAQADSALGQNIISQEAQRTAELENNPYLAKQYENSLRTYLEGLSTDLHAADVAKYAADLNSYATAYSGKRSGLAQAALGTAYQYQGLAQAAATRAQTAANNKYTNLYNYYYSKFPEQAASFAANKINSQYFSK